VCWRVLYVSGRRFGPDVQPWTHFFSRHRGLFELLIGEQTELVRQLREIVGGCEVFRAAVIPEDPSVASDVDDPNYSLCERTTASAERILANYPRDGESFNGVPYPHAYWEGVVARWRGDHAKAQSAFLAAGAELEKMLEKQPDFPAALSLLGIVDAGLGRTKEAVAEGIRACELVPISKDSFDGVAFAVNLAQIYTWIGDKERAINQIAEIERLP
jgi:hypothetical protein